MPKGRHTSHRIWLELFFQQVNSSPGCLPCLGSQGRLVVGVELVQGAGLPGTSARYGVQEISEHSLPEFGEGCLQESRTVTRSWEYKEEAHNPMPTSPEVCYLYFVGFLDSSCFDPVEGKVGSGVYNNLQLDSLQVPQILAPAQA